MNVDELKNRTLEKIKRLDFDFTEEEITFILIDAKLLRELFYQLSINKNLVDKNINLILKIVDLVDEITGEEAQEALGYCYEIEEEMMYSSLRHDLRLVDIEQLNSDDEYFRIFEEKLTNKEFTNTPNHSFFSRKENIDSIIIKLLNNKNYEAIYNLTFYSKILIYEEATFERFMNEFPFDSYPIDLYSVLQISKDSKSNNLYNKLLEKQDLLNFETLRRLYFLSDSAFTNSSVVDEERENIKNQLVKKLNQPNSNLNYNMNGISNDFGYLFIQSYDEFDKIILNNFNQPIAENNISIYLNHNIDIKETEIDDLCNIIINVNYNNIIKNKYLLENDTFIKSIINLGMINILPSNIISNNIEYFKEQTIKAIDENNINFLSKIKLSTSSTVFKNIILELINKNKFDLINLDSCKDEDIQAAIIKKIFDLPLEELQKYELFNNRVNRDLFIELLNKNQPEKAFALCRNLNANVIIDNFSLISKAIESNFTYAYSVFNLLGNKIITNDNFRKLYYSLDTDYFKYKMLDYLAHNENFKQYYNKELYDATKDMFITKYNLNVKHMDALVEKYGYIIVKYISSPNLISIINLDDENFNKFIELFPCEEYKMSDLEAIYDSFKQEEFSKENPDIIGIFPNIMHGIENKDDNIIKYLNELKTVWCDKLINKIISAYPDEEAIIRTNIDYIDYIANNIINASAGTKEKYTNILHIVSDYYIASKREDYRKTYNLTEECKLKFNYDEKDFDKLNIIKFLEIGYISNLVGYEGLYEKFYNKIINELIENGLTKEEASDIILYIIKSSLIENIKSRSNYGMLEMLERKYDYSKISDILKNIENKYEELDNNLDLKKNIGLVFKLCFKNIKEYKEEDQLNLSSIDKDKAKRKYYVSKPEYDIFELFSNIRVEFLSDCVLNNPEIYTSLKNIIKKYKLDCISSDVDSIADKEIFDLECSSKEISTFISFFHKIYEEEKSSLEAQGKDSKDLTISFMKIYKYLDKYSAVSSIYSQILGTEDSQLIRSDPGPNSSSGITKDERLKKAVEKTFENFKKQSIRVPGFNYDATLENGKTLSAIVGNFTRPTNLTHGERTGACMRIGGAGETLFNSDEIFHIEFVEPNTGKYISRVTGFRNGNTVFLNELRYSCDKELYSDLDVVEACKQVAQQFIEKTKDSSYPIDNVVIHRDYAMKEVEDNRVELGIKNNKKGMKQFYSDVGSFVHVLASTSEKGFAEVKLGNDDVPLYQPVREKIRSGSNKKIVEQINRIYTINQALQGRNYYINPIADNIVYGIVGEDWYVCIDENNNLITERIDRDERSLAEFEYAKEEIKKYFVQPEEKEVQHAV